MRASEANGVFRKDRSARNALGVQQAHGGNATMCPINARKAASSKDRCPNGPGLQARSRSSRVRPDAPLEFTHYVTHTASTLITHWVT